MALITKITEKTTQSFSEKTALRFTLLDLFNNGL